jgi:uncharacterized protein YecE (DUF72 family)
LSGETESKDNQDLLVGVGGWAYLPIKSGNKLEVCSKLYDFVEVNSTFYSMPPIERVKSWRKKGGENLEFTVKANRELTHVGHLEPTKRNFKIFEELLEMCRILNAQILQFQFPASYEVTDRVVSSWRDFFRSTSGRGLCYAIEARSPSAGSSENLKELIEEHDLIPTTDATRAEGKIPYSPKSKILYTRVFGKEEKWSFDTEEIHDLTDRVQSSPARKKYVTFHNMTMYEDASRMKTVVKTGNDQNASPNAPLGLDSLKNVLTSGRIRFPATKQKLIEEFGWKIYDVDVDKKAHVSSALELLSDSLKANYRSAEEVVEKLKN